MKISKQQQHFSHALKSLIEAADALDQTALELDDAGYWIEEHCNKNEQFRWADTFPSASNLAIGKVPYGHTIRELIAEVAGLVSRLKKEEIEWK